MSALDADGHEIAPPEQAALSNMPPEVRAKMAEAMKARGIGTGVHYPAIHLFSAYRALGYREGQFPNAERIGRETVTLPLFPAMQLGDVDRVVVAVEAIVRGARR